MMPTTETEESSKLERLQMRRKGYQTFVMRLIQEFDEICEAETHDYERIEIIDQHLQDKQKLIDALNENVLTLCDVGDIIGEIEQSEQTNDLILSKRKGIKAMLTNRDKLCSKVKANKNESTESQSPEVQKLIKPEVPKLNQQEVMKASVEFISTRKF